MNTITTGHIEELFSSLIPEEKLSIISCGVAIRLSALRKRLVLAEEHVRRFEEKYRTSLDKFDAEGLPDDAGYGMHEDYIMWHHWIEAVEETRKRIASLQEIAKEGLYAGDILDAGY